MLICHGAEIIGKVLIAIKDFAFILEMFW